jgi:hypothetical protein
MNWIHLAQKGPEARSCERGNEPSGSIKGKEFHQQRTICFFKKDSAQTCYSAGKRVLMQLTERTI